MKSQINCMIDNEIPFNMMNISLDLLSKYNLLSFLLSLASLDNEFLILKLEVDCKLVY